MNIIFMGCDRELSNYLAIREMLKRISGQENVFTVPKIYVQYTGDLTTAILLNQIVYYSDKSKRPDGFFYKTYKDWEEEICLTERQVRYSTKKLKDRGIIETKLLKANGAPTVHYKLLFDNFAESILTFCQIPFLQSVGIHSDDLSETLTEITTKNTTKITTKDNIPLQIENLRQRYSESQLNFIDEYFEMLKHTRVSAKISDSIRLKIYQSWDKHPPVCVEYGVRTHTANPSYHSKKENYTLGIIRNTTADEAVDKLGQKGGGKNGKNENASSDAEKYGLPF